MGAVSLESGADILEVSASLKLPESLQGTKHTLQAAVCADKACRLVISGDDHTITAIHQPGTYILMLTVLSQSWSYCMDCND